jgi:hypothetical protein
MHKTTKRLRAPKEAERHFPGFIAFKDCTEQQIPRPENRRRKKTYYSGKRKRHTIKTHLMVNNCGVIIHKTKHKRGHRHDYNIYKKNHPVTPKDAVNVFDLGHLGGGRDFPDQTSYLPNKNKRNHNKLSQEEKDYNQNHSRKRVVMEHTICMMKKYRIVSDIFRNRLRYYDKISEIASGAGKLQHIVIIFLEEISHCRTDRIYCF